MERGQNPTWPAWLQALESFEAPGRAPTGTSVADAESVPGADGRTYHGYKEGRYWLPNDEDEQDRLDWQHQLVTTLLGGRLACAPIRDPEYVLVRQAGRRRPLLVFFGGAGFRSHEPRTSERAPASGPSNSPSSTPTRTSSAPI